MHHSHGRRPGAPPRWGLGVVRAGTIVAVALLLHSAGAIGQPVPPTSNTDAVVAALARAALTWPTPAPARPRYPGVSGQIAFSPVFNGGNAPTFGMTRGALDFTSSSRMTVDFGRARLNLGIMKPTTFGRVGQPDQFYSAELLYGRQAIRVGDVTPRFTDHTTGYARVHGVEAQLALGRLLQFNAVHGLSQRATHNEGSSFGTYRRTLSGARLALTPWRPMALAFTAVRLADTPGVVDFSASPLAASRPGENLVFGSDLTLHFLQRRRGQLVLEYAASVYTDDLAAPDSLGRVRGEDLSPAGIARSGLVRSLVTLNDSTRVGHAITARMVLPTGPGRTTLEYRRTSPLFATLAQPWAQSGLARYRAQTMVPLFDRSVQVAANAEYSRAEPGRLQPFGVDAVGAYASVTMERTPVGRLTVGMRGHRRANDAPAPDSLRPERRMRTTMLTPSVTVERDFRIGVPLALTFTLSGSSYTDAIRPTSAYHTLGGQLSGQTPQSERLQIGVQGRYARTVREATGATQNSAELVVREGYDISPRRLHLFVRQGIGGDRSSDGWQRSNLFTYGAGARWTPNETTGLELDWQSRQSVNIPYPDFSYGQHTVELRITHRW